MKKIHLSTTIGLVLDLMAIVCLAFNFSVVAAVLAIGGYFASIKEVSKYTSWYQFTVVFASAIIAGWSLDLAVPGIPFITLALFFAAAGSILRIVFFSFFSYTGHSWLEPLMLLACLTLYSVGLYSGSPRWDNVGLPVPVILFTGVLAWGIVKDKKQLLAHTRGGYKVQIGKEATEFELPDQDGNAVKLSAFKDQRHVLLIFVRGDWCPGCHMMLRTYERNREKFQDKNVLVMAIGPDPVGVNRQMVEKLGVEFRVLSDEGQKTAMTYGVQLKEYDNDFADKYEEGIPLPASFLIDKKGVVRYVSRPDKVGEFLNPSLIFPIVEQLA